MLYRGITRGAQFPERRVTMGVRNHCGAPNGCGGAKQSQQCHKYFFQYSTFSSEKPKFRTWVRQICFLSRAPSNLVTPLMVLAKWRHSRSRYSRTWMHVNDGNSAGSEEKASLLANWRYSRSSHGRIPLYQKHSSILVKNSTPPCFKIAFTSAEIKL